MMIATVHVVHTDFSLFLSIIKVYHAIHSGVSPVGGVVVG